MVHKIVNIYNYLLPREHIYLLTFMCPVLCVSASLCNEVGGPNNITFKG